MTDHANISITPAAAAHIKNQLQLTQAQYLRLSVKESGCNGYMYTLDFVDTPATEDLIVDVDPAISLIVSKSDLRLVGGTQIDLVTEGLNSSLQFKNPNAESHCGCGESFSVPASVNGRSSSSEMKVAALS